MNDSKFRYILYIIIVVILSTIAIQTFWNYKNYLNNKQQLINDVQLSLDNAVDDYYAELAKRTTLGIWLEGDQQKNAFEEHSELQKFLNQIDENDHEFTNLDSIKFNSIEGITVVRGHKADSLNQIEKNEEKSLSTEEFKKRIQEIKATNPLDSMSFDVENIEMLTKKIVISINNDSLDIKKVDALLKADLKRKNIDLNYSLSYNDSSTDSLAISMVHHTTLQQNKLKDGMFLSSVSNSSFLPPDCSLSIHYENTTWIVLKRIFGGILISTLLVLAVISCLFYLLKVIKHQKQLSEVKNDLISNITHEFKTPIATIGVALESIKSFNAIDDKEKTKTYLDMSSTQLSKLNTMVEKLLETATIDSEDLELNKDRYNISEVITTVVEKHEMQNDKLVNYDIDDNVFINVDVFHFENAINNIIDNAFKYGGDQVDVLLKSKSSQIEIYISDNGTTLSKANKDRVFEKFYRVPKGNTHDVKGFGIGLYYTKKIIEKHNGTIQIQLDKHKTTFKIVFPYA